MGNDIAFDFPTKSALVVDDEEPVRRVVKLALLARNFVVLEARDGTEALQLIEQHTFHCKFDVLVTDIRMPGCDGVTVAIRFMAACPLAGVVLMSGYADVESLDLEGLGRQRKWVFVPKPFRIQTLTKAVAQVIGSLAD